MLEHFPDPKKFLESSYANLKPGGFLLISIPSSDGWIFKLSGLISRLGLKTVNDRIWQRQFYAPHYSYFNRGNLSILAMECGFCPVMTESLDVIESATLFDRISVDKSAGTLNKVFLLISGYAYSLISKVSPEEYFFTIFRKN